MTGHMISDLVFDGGLILVLLGGYVLIAWGFYLTYKYHIAQLESQNNKK